MKKLSLIIKPDIYGTYVNENNKNIYIDKTVDNCTHGPLDYELYRIDWEKDGKKEFIIFHTNSLVTFQVSED